LQQTGFSVTALAVDYFLVEHLSARQQAVVLKRVQQRLAGTVTFQDVA
jgi:hypothetical protein